jgi:general secretion pathway protein L
MYLRIGASPDQASMVVLDADGRLVDAPRSVSLAEAAERAGDQPVSVLLPATEIVSCVAKLPSASPARLRQMLPYTLEDEFAGDIDDLHFAAGDRNDSDGLSISVIERKRLDFWLDALRSAGLHARRICSEADAIPDTPGLTTLFVDGRTVMGRRPQGAPFNFEELGLAELWPLLEAEREDHDDLEQVVLFVDPASRTARAAEIDAWRAGTGNVDVVELADGCLPRLAANLAHRPGPNLLQGDYAPHSSYAALARPWRLAAGFVLAFIALGLVGKGALVYKLSRDEARLTDEIAAVCAQRYGGARVNDCRIEMLRRLDAAGQTAAGGGDGYLATQAVVADAAGEAIEMQAISFQDDVMTLTFLSPSAQFVASFSESVNRSGHYQVVEPSTEDEGDRTRVRLRIVPVLR